MGVAKDEAAVPAVVAALEEGEGFGAGRGVADGGFDVRFPVLARGEGGYRGEVIFFGGCRS